MRDHLHQSQRRAANASYRLCGELVVVDAVSGARTIVVKLPRSAADLSFALTPDARTFYYGVERSESDIWIVERPKR